MVERITDYRHKVVITKQIMSNKARRLSKVNTLANVTTVIVASLLTFMGFAGIPKINGYVNLIAGVRESTVELIFNSLVFALFVLVILHLVFRFGEKESKAQRAIVSLTYLLHKIDDTLARAEAGYSLSQGDIDLVRDQYDMLLQNLPSNSDREWLKAKRDFAEKQEKKLALQMGARDLFDESARQRVVQALLKQSTILMQILHTLRTADERLYLGGSLIRNAVWDYLHGYSSPTPIDDIDVIYFDGASDTKAADEAIETKLQLMLPNLKWSVKNQARMHSINSEGKYTSLSDAIEKWPETATAIVARLTAGGDIEFIAPYGFGDLFRLIVAPTEHFRSKTFAISRTIESQELGKALATSSVYRSRLNDFLSCYSSAAQLISHYQSGKS